MSIFTHFNSVREKNSCRQRRILNGGRGLVVAFDGMLTPRVWQVNASTNENLRHFKRPLVPAVTGDYIPCAEMRAAASTYLASTVGGSRRCKRRSWQTNQRDITDHSTGCLVRAFRRLRAFSSHYFRECHEEARERKRRGRPLIMR